MTKQKKNIVFWIPAIISLLIAFLGIIFKQSFSNFAETLMLFLKQKFSWIYLITMLFFVIFILAIGFSPFGKIRLGADNEKPEYSLLSWFAMLFAAGMGIGLVFWGIAEPLSHYASPMNGITPFSEEAKVFSMRSSFMHWGLHPWACYAIMGLGLAYIQFRKKQPALVSNLVKPLLGTGKKGHLLGQIIDIFTTVLTILGVAASFGMGCLQICGGLNYLFGIDNTTKTWFIIISLVCICYLTSAILGVSKGIQLLSNLNLILCVVLVIVTLFIAFDPSIITVSLSGAIQYITHFFPDSLRLTSNGDGTWIQNWRIFYWAWWVSWAPFVGLFIARISKGRTVREFIFGVTLVPTMVSIIWFSVFGGVALNTANFFTQTELLEIVQSPQTSLFIIFSKYPGGILLSIIALVLLFVFFITSADSATFVLAMITSDANPNPPNRKKVFWGVLLALIAFVLILSGGVSGTQTLTIVAAFPYLFILLTICLSIFKMLKKDAAN